jgi:hypothetical protein
MKRLFYFSIILVIFSSCSEKNAKKNIETNKYSSKEISCLVLENESFDTTIILKGSEVRLNCKTDCYKEYTIPDTFKNEIYLYHDRFFKFSIKSSDVDTQFVVSKELFYDVYKNNMTFRRSVIGLPKIKGIDTTSNSILMKCVFAFPSSIFGTDFFEEIDFSISVKGDATFKEVIPFNNNVE